MAHERDKKMDENKWQKLMSVGYSMYRTCAICNHSNFPLNDWGTCKIHKYKHKKHTEQWREMSIHKSGGCPDFELDEKIDLGKFFEMI